VTHYTIPVGQFFPGTFDYLFFATAGESLFSNVQVSQVP
jgi:hypothetical protein